MTIETKTTIQLNDIKTIEFECKNCHRVISWPLLQFNQPPMSCDCAVRGTWMSHGGATFASLINLVRAINHLAVANEPYELRFVIDGPVSSDQQGA